MYLKIEVNLPVTKYKHNNDFRPFTLVMIFFFRYPNVGDLHRYVGVNVLLVEYRGYGRSEGSPSESGKILQVKV